MALDLQNIINTATERNTGDKSTPMPVSSTVDTLPERLSFGTVSADSLSKPVSPVTVPQPTIEPPITPSPQASSVKEDVNQIITAQTEEADRLKELRNQQASLADETTLSELFTQTQSNFGVPENLKQIKDIQLQLADMDTASALTKTQIEGAAGQTLGQAQREVTQEDRENAVRTAGLAARASVLQGNIETATTLTNQAVQTAYQDRTLRNSNLISQITSLQGVVDNQTAQLLETDKRKYEADQLEIASATSSVSAAVASGFASAQDIEAMTALSGDPKAQKEYADKIVAKAARSAYQLKLSQLAAAKSKAAQDAQSEADSIAKQTALSTQETIAAIDNIRNKRLGIKAATGATWLGRTALSAGIEEGGIAGFVGGTGFGSAVGTVIPGAGTLFGGAFGGVTGFTAGTAMGTAAAASQRVDVMSDLSFMVNEATFTEMRRLKQQGVTFGSLTEGERIAIGRAADALFSALDVEPDGTVSGINVTEDKFYTLLDNYEQKRVKFQDEVNRVAAGFDDSDTTTIDNLE